MIRLDTSKPLCICLSTLVDQHIACISCPLQETTAARPRSKRTNWHMLTISVRLADIVRVPKRKQPMTVFDMNCVASSALSCVFVFHFRPYSVCPMHALFYFLVSTRLDIHYHAWHVLGCMSRNECLVCKRSHWYSKIEKCNIIVNCEVILIKRP